MSATTLRRTQMLLIAAAGCVAYHNSFGGVFLLDDDLWIVSNPDLRVLWPPTVAMGESLRPLAFYSFAVNVAISGTEAWSYHVVNLALHVTTALATFGLVRRALRLPRVGMGGTRPDGIALAVALLWVVHPLNTQAVVYIVQRAELMMGLAYVLTLYAFVRSVETGDRGVRRRWSVVAVLAFYAGLGCKEVIVTAPLVVLLFDALAVTGTFRDTLRRRWPLYVALFAPFVLGPLWWWITNPDRSVLLTPNEHAPGHFDYITAQGAVILGYLRLVVWPVDQSFDHAWSPAHHSTALLPSAVVIGAALVASIVGVWRKSVLAWLGLTLFLVLAPSSGLVPLSDFFVEHRMYLPLLPCVVAVVLGLDALSTHVVTVPETRRAVVLSLLVAVTAALTAASVRRNALYESRVGMWTDVVAKSPHNVRAQFNLGLSLLDAGGSDLEQRALERFLTVVELNPEHGEAHTNVGTILYRRGEIERAERHYRAALGGASERFVFHNNHGTALMELGRPADAVEAFERALDQLSREPEQEAEEPRLRNNLGVCRAHLDQAHSAIPHFERAVELDPTLAEAWANLVRTLAGDGRLADAEDAARRACVADPGMTGHRDRLIQVLALRARDR